MSSPITKTKDSLELKKHVGLIHSANKLTLLERKIANALLYHAYDELLKKSEHQIYIPSLCKTIGYNSKDYKTIKRSLISLISTVLEWNLIDQGKAEQEGVWMASSMLSDAKIEGSVCTYSYSNRMRELCYYPEFYGRLNMQILSKFKSTYGIALYENCVRYQNIKQTPWIELPVYRKLMGIKDGQYELFRDLNKRVIKPSVNEVNAYATIQVNPELKKQGRAVIAIRFLICKQSNPAATMIHKPIEANDGLSERLERDYGLTTQQIKQIMSAYDETYLTEKMALIEASPSYCMGKIENLAKYLQKALQDDFQPPKSSKAHVDQRRVKREENRELQKIQEERREQFRKYQNSALVDVINNLDAKKKNTLNKDFGHHIGSTIYANLYAEHGYNNPLVQDRLGFFIRSQYPELLAMLKSFEEYAAESSL